MNDEKMEILDDKEFKNLEIRLKNGEIPMKTM